MYILIFLSPCGWSEVPGVQPALDNRHIRYTVDITAEENFYWAPTVTFILQCMSTVHATSES